MLRELSKKNEGFLPAWKLVPRDAHTSLAIDNAQILSNLLSTDAGVTAG